MKRHGIIKKDLEFGQRVMIYNKLERREIRTSDDHRRGQFKSWQVNPFKKEFKPKVGIFLGYCTVSDGTRCFYSDHIDEEAPALIEDSARCA